MKSLILAEKPSVARDIADALQINQKRKVTLKITNILSRGR